MPDVKLLQSWAAYFAAVETRYLLTKKRFASVAMRERVGDGWGREGLRGGGLRGLHKGRC